MTRRACLPIRHGDVLLGFLWVIVGDRPLSDGERATIARGGAEVADEPVGPPARGRRAPHAREHAAAGAFAGEDVAAALASALRWPATGAFAVVVCAGERRSPSASAAAAAPPTSRGWPRTAASSSSPATRRRNLRRRCSRRRARPAACAAYEPRRALARALRRAEIAALCARAEPALGPVAAWGALGSWGLVADLWTQRRPAPADHPVLELERHRRRDQLFEALTVFLEAGGDATEAAKTLHLHRASLYRRLDRIEEATGLDLRRGDDRLTAHLGLRLLRLYNART